MTEEIIRQIVTETPGIKATEVVGLVLERLHEKGGDLHVDLPQILERMVREGAIGELEYVLPDSDYRIRSLYFPIGTVGILRNLPKY